MSEMKLKELLEQYPFVVDFFESTGFDISENLDSTFVEILDSFSEEELEEKAIDKEEIKIQLDTFIKQMLQFLGDSKENIESLTIFPGHNKSGEKEKIDACKEFGTVVLVLKRPFVNYRNVYSDIDKLINHI